MSSQGQQTNNTTHENAIGWMILGGVFLALFFLFWYFFEYQMKDALRFIRLNEMRLVALFVDEDYTVTIDGIEYPLEISIEDVKKFEPEELEIPLLGTITRMALQPMKLPISIVLGLMGFWALFYGPGTQYRRRMNLDGIIAAQAKNFPAINPFVKFNPSHKPSRPPGAPVPVELPLFSEALGPEEWISYNQIPIPDGALDEKVSFSSFAKQLGARWQGPMRLPAYKQVLLAAFCLKASRKRDESDSMLGRLAMCWSHDQKLQLGKDKTLLKEARAVLKSRDLAGLTLSKCNQHSFHTTALLRALQTAREEGGVLAPAQFVWLRGYDRTLWYPLNNLGRQAFHMEALGAMSHFKAEKLTQRPIPKPKLDGAVSSITDYMSSDRARPIPQLDYSQSKKRGVKKPKAGMKKPK